MCLPVFANQMSSTEQESDGANRNPARQIGGSGTTQVLTFSLADGAYCVNIECVAEIVDATEIRGLPDTDRHVEGITDLRGQTTTIVDPTELLDISHDEVRPDGGQTDNRIIVLDPSAIGTETNVGWLVEDVHEVREVTEETLDTESINDTELFHGLLTDGDEFTLWLDPDRFTA